METIIQQIVIELTEKLLKDVEKNGMNLNELTKMLLEDCQEAARRLVEACAREVNEQMRYDKQWRKGLLVLKEKNRKRRILTFVGELQLERDYYYDQENGCYATPMDEVLGIASYERLLPSIGAELVTQAAECSYERSAKIVTGGAVSRQTVRNQILKLQVPEKEPETLQKAVKELHLFADEDHVHMQKPNKQKGKANQIVPLVTVTEGINEENARHRTVNPMSFVDEDFDTKQLWKSVSGYIGKAYDVEALERIWIHGDGGKWIQNGLEEYTQTMHIIDGYHFERDLKRIANLFPGRNVRQRLHDGIEKDDRKRVEEILQDLMEIAADKKTLERVEKFGGYLLSHWEEMRRRLTEEVPGSCTEGQVSHLLSKRFSRHPMGWSKEGLGKLSRARIYLKNGGELTNQDLKRTEDERSETYSTYADRMLDEVMKGASDWNLFSQKENIPFDQASGTQQLLHRVGSYHSILN